MARMALAIVAFHLIIGGSAVTLRRSATENTNIEAVTVNGTGIPLSAFSPSFIADVDAHLDQQFGTNRPMQASLLSTKVAPSSGSFMALAGHGVEKLDVETALKAMTSPPPSVVDMLRQGYKTAAGANMWKADVDTKVVEKAIVNLNGMVFAAQIRLDAKTDECEEFKAKYTETLDQINSDLSRLGQGLSNIARAISNHQGGMEANILNNQKAKEELMAEETAYMNVRNADMIVLQERQTNLAVSAFIVVFSACPDAPSASSMLQINRSATADRLTPTDVQKCVNGSGATEIHFQDEKLESAAQRLSDEAQQMLLRFIAHEQSVRGDKKDLQAARRLEAAALGEVEVMTEDLDDGDVDPPAENDEEADEHTREQEEEQAGDDMSLFQKKQDPWEQRVEEPPREEQQRSNRCTNAKFDCGILHDMFAALWGETKDLVDELTYKMNQDTKAWEKVKGDINTLLQVQSTQMSNLQAALAESMAMKAAVTDEQSGKQKEKVDTTHLFDSTMKECQDVMKEILYMEICGVLAVRNNIVAKNLPGEPTPTDCAVGEFVVSDCSVSCDDELQGGTHALKREVMVMNSKRGVACPVLTTTRKCKQIPCPVNCQLSSWSGWNKCSKECGGGVQSATRSSVQRAANGGEACDAFSQTQACNTGSCDVDCELGQWMDFKPCNKACNLGYAERRKRMVSEAQGEGFCLPWDDKERLERKPCNAQPCTGDETCNSTIDLVIAIDASGSITEAGFDIMKEFAARMVRRMRAPVQVGVVLFGNGKLDLETNIISNAKVVTDNLEGDMEAVAGKIEGTVIHKGFTNMAQAFTKSKDVLTYARKGAQATVMIVTDGRPSFKFQTGFAVQSLRKSARVMIIHVQANRKEDIAKLLKGYASEPWSMNYRHIPGKKQLAYSYDSYITSALADLCPKLVSPSALTDNFVSMGMGYCESGYYKGWGDDPNSYSMTAERCADICKAEPECKYFAVLPRMTCSRYNEQAGACPSNNDQDHFLYKKKAEASF